MEHFNFSSFISNFRTFNMSGNHYVDVKKI